MQYGVSFNTTIYDTDGCYYRSIGEGNTIDIVGSDIDTLFAEVCKDDPYITFTLRTDILENFNTENGYEIVGVISDADDDDEDAFVAVVVKGVKSKNI